MSGNKILEEEVFRIIEFSKEKEYFFALKTRSEGKWPKQKHYTTNPLQYVGKYVRSERWGYGDGSGGAEIFNLDGKQVRIELDYEGRTCFKETLSSSTPSSTPRRIPESPRRETLSSATQAFSASVPSATSEDKTLDNLEKANLVKVVVKAKPENIVVKAKSDKVVVEAKLEEEEVFRYIKLSQEKEYYSALRTRSEGIWPNQKYYTTNPLQYVGKYIGSERWGFGDGSGGTELFILDGKQVRIELDYEGRTCFKEVDDKALEKLKKANLGKVTAEEVIVETKSDKVKADGKTMKVGCNCS